MNIGEIITSSWFRDVIYLISVVFFILGLKRLGSPRTARSGNIMSSFGMFLAIAITLLDREIISYEIIAIAVVVGALIGVVMAKKVEMTSMPEMVALFNGFGGIASALVAFAEYYDQTAPLKETLLTGAAGVAHAGFEGNLVVYITLMLSVLVGLVTFSGSFIAFAKLAEIMNTKPMLFFGQQALNAIMFIGAVVLAVMLYQDPAHETLFWSVAGISLILGITLTIPIGGADMPVVVSLLNSYSGIAVSMTGFVLGNNALVIVGSLVGASGIILTMIMCRGMNRSLANVIFGGFGAVADDGGEGGPQGTVRSMTPEEAGMVLDMAESVIIVPGYGMAVSQAQHAVKEFTDLLDERGIDVKFAIHPVAGRMPGHMNVLLAEAGIDYEKLYDMEINNHFPHADVAIVIGANDVVNPGAKTNKSSPIYGMPVLDVELSRQVFVLKRSMKPGFAGIENELFFKENTTMVFGDAKKTIEGFTMALEELGE